MMLTAGGFTDAVRYKTQQTRGQLWHRLREFRKSRHWESQNSAVCDSSTGHSELLHPGEGQHSGDVARFGRKHNSFAAEFAAPLKLPLENHKHPVRWITLAHISIACLDVRLLRFAQ